MSRTRRVAVAVLATLVCALGVRQTASSPAAQEPTVAYGAGEGAAAKLAADLCASCHGDDLRGGRASSLLDETWVFGGSDADIAESIRDGRPGTLMAPFKAALDEQQIRSLVVLIRELAEKARVEAPTAPAVPFDAVRAASGTPSGSRPSRTGSTRRGASSSCRTAASW